MVTTVSWGVLTTDEHGLAIQSLWTGFGVRRAGADQGVPDWIKDITFSTASAILTGCRALARGLISTSPLARDFSPMPILMGKPTSSESLNLTPGRSFRSSRMVSTP